MTPKISLIAAVVAAALVVGVPAAFGDNWGADRQDGTALTQRGDIPTAMLDARERAQLSSNRAADHVAAVEARKRVFDAMSRYPDWAERATAVVPPNSSLDRFIANDKRVRVMPQNDRVTVPTVGSGTDIEWPQIGVGAGLGILIALGLMLVVRTTRSRELAH